MKAPLITALIALGLTSACATSRPLSTPNNLPINWSAPEVISQNATDVVHAPQTHASTDVRATSLWSSSPKSLFGDRRASKYGDILTVVIEVDDEAEIRNSVDQSRQSNQGFSVNALFGLPENINRQLPGGATLSPAIDLDRSSNVSGNGNIKREEKLTLRLAARVVEILPNGYLSLAGRQEIMVNNETRYLQVTGLVRTEDISRLNTITYDKIADARIFYGGQGQLTRSVRSGWGNTALSKIVPF